MKYIIAIFIGIVSMLVYLMIASMIGDHLKRRFSARDDIANDYEQLRPFLRMRGGKK